MATWTDCTSTPSYFGGFAADMGEYVGPWPMMPPPFVLNGDASTRDEVDFYLALPNPADPTDVTIVGDGTYATPIWDCWRSLNNAPPPPDSYLGYATDGVGGATDPGSTGTPPAGCHLYVSTLYGPIGALVAPSDPPAAFVPSNYTAAGTCASQTLVGAWSDWQDAIDETASTSTPDAWGFSRFVNPTSTSGLTNLEPKWQTALDTILAQTTSDNATASAFRIMGQKGHFGFPGTDQSIVQIDEIGQDSVTYEATISRGDNTVLGSLEIGVDYGLIPWTSDSADFEDETVDYEWTSIGAVSIASGSASGAAAGLLPLSVTYRVDVRATPLTPSSPLGWYTDGTELTTVIVNSSDGSGVGHTIDLSSFSGSVTPSAADVELTVLHGVNMFWTGLWETAAGPDFANSAGSYVFSAQLNFGAGSGGHDPEVNWSTGRWRYRLPETVGPAGVAWHTLGGHWGNLGAGLKILTPIGGELVPVDVVDGPG